jgi:ribose transport system substrate-binding protein
MRSLTPLVRSQALVALAVLALAFAGCGGGAPAPVPAGSGAGESAAKPAGKRLTIAVIPKGTTHDFWKSVHAGAMQAGKEFDVDIVWDGTVNEKDKEGQIKIIQSQVVNQVDGICLAPIDRTALIRPVVAAKQAGVPTVIFDSGLEDSSAIVSYVATDNLNGGKIAGKKMGELLGGKGNVILLRYAAGSESTEQREQGFLETLAAEFPEIKIVSENQRAGSDADEARRLSESLLNEIPDVDGVFTVCEPNNKGMLVALENKQLAGKVKFVGFDSDPRFVAAMKANTMHGIVLQDPVRMGYLAVKTMAEHLRGQKVEPRVSTGEVLATPENMDEEAVKKLLEPAKFEG